MLQKLRIKLDEFRLWAFYFLVWAFSIDQPYKELVLRANQRIKALEADREKLSAAVEKFDRNVSLDVRSQLHAIDWDSLGDLVWIKVGDERMLRHDVFNQVRDYMNSHSENSILIMTGPNVELQALSDQQLTEAGLRRLSPRERN